MKLTHINVPNVVHTYSFSVVVVTRTSKSVGAVQWQKCVIYLVLELPVDGT